MFAGIGVQRVGLGLQFAESSRYVYMGAMLLAPMIAVAIDRLGVLSPAALHAGRLILVASALLNIGQLLGFGSDWAKRSTCERDGAVAARRRPGPHGRRRLGSTSRCRSAPTSAWRTSPASSPTARSRRGRRRARPTRTLINAALDSTRTACPGPT